MAKPKPETTLEYLQKSLKVAEDAVKHAEVIQKEINAIEKEMDAATKPLHKQIERVQAPYKARMKKLNVGPSHWTLRQDAEKIRKLIRQENDRERRRVERKRLVMLGSVSK